MPKLVDHEERRRAVARAVWRIASADGLEAVSMRRVAAAAGFTAPTVQHYFPDKNTMLRYALAELGEQADRTARERVTAVMAGTSDTDSPRRMLRAVLAECLPLDEGRRTLLLVNTAYFARALADSELASFYRDASPALSDYLVGLLGQAQRAGRVPATVDVRREIDSLLTLAIGLGTEMLLEVRPADEAIELLDYHLDRLLGPGPG